MKLVAVTACPTGIAHTYMAAERLEKIAKKMGHEMKVETQGAMGIENELSEDDIKNASIAIFAVGIPVQKKERFDNIKVVEISIQDAIKKTEEILQKVTGYQ